MAEKLETDYLVVGAGGMGMAFVDEILTQTDATVVMVDKKYRPGGHWNDAYPFVRLHQASICYGVNSTPLGKYRIDEVGYNKGCYELASGSEVVAYFDTVMRERFLPSGRVRFLPLSEYRGGGKVVSLVNGQIYEVVAKKVVDATYMNVTVPSQRPPKFDVLGKSEVIPPNDLPKRVTERRPFVIVGSGKTGMDACLFLLEHGVDPAEIVWVMPNDAWLFDRQTVNPGRKFTDTIATGRIDVLNAILEATSVDDFFQRALACEQLLQFDAEVKPERWRCATVTKLELTQLQKIKNVVRLGHLESVNDGKMSFKQGEYSVPLEAVIVDCAADGLARRPSKKVFDGNLITLQTVRMCQQVYSAGFIGNIEANLQDEDRMNALCAPVPQPFDANDYLRCAMQDSENMLIWLTEPSVVSWINNSRIDLFSPVFDFDDPEVVAQIEAMGELLTKAIPKMRQLLKDAA